MISLDAIKAYLEKRLPERSFAIEPILGLGEVNQVYKVAAHEQNFVLRVNQADDTF